MMGALAIRRWAWVHRWSSLVCTVFMLLLCLTVRAPTPALRAASPLPLSPPVLLQVERDHLWDKVMESMQLVSVDVSAF